MAETDKEKKAIERIKLGSEMSEQYYEKPIVCVYSGGKDSDVMLELFKRSGVNFEVHHSHTTADAPQTVYYIRKVFAELENQGIKCTIELPFYKGVRTSMWSLIPQKLMPPTRLVRYCCSVLKETGCRNRMIATGIRWDESTSRKSRSAYETIGHKKIDKISVSDEKMLLSDNNEKRMLFEKCEMKAKTVVNPIIDWKNREVWEFYRNECKNHNPLYDMGFTRVGCIGCPMVDKQRWHEFNMFPKYKKMYVAAFDRMIVERNRRGKQTEWKTGADVFDWWMNVEKMEGQLRLEDLEG